MTRAAWTIRPKGERDAEAVGALLAQVAREGNAIATEWPFDVEARVRAIRDMLLSLRCVGWIALERHSLIGDLTVTDIDHAEPELGMIVDAAHRGRGIGRALLEHAVAWARANGKQALTLRVFPDNERARELYLRSGFVEIALQPSAIPRRDGTARDAILMRRPIAEPLADR